MKPPPSKSIADLRNIGKAMLKDFELLGIKSVKQLASCDADKLYARIQKLTNTRHDPCVWDTYAAAIHQAKTGEALPWWEFTKVRKNREAQRRSDSLPPSWGRARERGAFLLKRSSALRSTPHPTPSHKGRG